MPVTIQITPGSAVPIYQQIVRQVRQAVAVGAGGVGGGGGGGLKAGEMLPSVRVLAEELVINPNTVAKAYGELVHEGLVESLAGKGLVVLPRRNVFTKAERLRRLDPLLTELVQAGLAAELSAEDLHAALDKKIKSVLGG